ncbi:MAG: FAD-binding oxidoreductase [Proteobacteria bacterium]|nr:FAD-binding oxidoreductase [Pseudomonadota bacterium]
MSVADVEKVVATAAEHASLLAVRGGGHSLPGLSTCDGGVVLDLSNMNAVTVDRSALSAEAWGGALLGDLDKASVPVGLVVPAGVVSHTGVAGLTLGGGMGWLSRRFGLTVDSLIAADIVTADGKARHVNSEAEPELFWAIRGGGGNFGVVTKFIFRTHELGTVLIGSWLYPVSSAASVLARYRDLAASAPRELSSGFIFTSAGLQMTAIWSGTTADAESQVVPFGGLGSPVEGSMGELSFLELQARFDEDLAWSRRYYTKGGFLKEIDDSAIERMVSGIDRAPSSAAEYYVLQLGGAVSDIADDAAPYTGRAAGHFWIAQAGWERPEDDTEFVGWTRTSAGRLSEISMQGNYVNEQADFGKEVALGAYGRIKYDRLAHLKARYDPENLFRLNQNIEPKL